MNIAAPSGFEVIDTVPSWSMAVVLDACEATAAGLPNKRKRKNARRLRKESRKLECRREAVYCPPKVTTRRPLTVADSQSPSTPAAPQLPFTWAALANAV